ncbi:unnamed protein product [Brachionus calyciflorus]|uniref:Uncharacterized protein n=1 Tax=Brachionus calyciflorus TaxID=104777 RepID=A0A814IYT5_9BILA|nr:unnamed protein product [Brachionus calyciflorus]
MGIRGLETFIDRYYNSEDRLKIFDELALSEIKLVIDGNQFAYVVSSLFKQGHYGGNYDQFYENLKNLLIQLKPSIECIIFDGAKESIEKCKNRLEQRITRMANLNSEECPSLSKEDHFKMLKDQPSLFNRKILYNLLNELGINYKMCEGLADHVIALYANGHNEKKEKFTVMSKASFFNVYNLENGYLSTKYVVNIFQNPISISSEKFHIFRLKKLMDFFRLESHKTWIYFCILLGNNDDVELRRNSNYFKEFHIDTRGGNLEHLIAHCKLEEERLIKTNYTQIRNTYVFKRDVALKKIDKLIELFEMKNSDFNFFPSPHSNYLIDDFDRIFLTIKSLNCFHLNCLVEDCQESSVFQPSIDFLHSIYAILLAKSEKKFSQIDEFIRTKTPSKDSLVDVSPITADMFNKVLKENKSFSFLSEIEKRMKQFNIRDNLTILFISLVVWQNWLDKELLKLSESENKLQKLKSENFLDAIIINFSILSLKLNSNLNCNLNDLTQESMVKEVVDKYGKKDHDILGIYEKIIKNIEIDVCVEEYYELDLKLVHRFNEFQTIYYMIGAMCKLNEFKFELLEPNRFLNSYFCVNYIKSLVMDENNNVENTEITKLEFMFKNNEVTKSLSLGLKNKIDFSRRIINRSSLKDLMKI